MSWQNGNMALRWCAAGLVEAGKQFRRVNGHEQSVGADHLDEIVNVA